MSHDRLRNALDGRGLLLLPAAALAVHELRYLLAHGDAAGAVRSAEGHGYLTSLAPWAALALALALGAFLVRVARSAASGSDSCPRRSFAGLWALASVSLAAIYTLQESLEGLLATGHPSGLTGVFGSGGWWGVAAAVALGAIVALLLRLAAVVASAAARRRRSRIARGARTASVFSSVSLQRWRGLRSAAAGRAPPTPVPTAA